MHALKLIVFTLFFASTLQIGCSPPDSDEKAIREARIKSNQAIAAKDTAALAKYWAEDFHVITSRNSEVSGRLKNQVAFAAEFDAGKLFVRTPKKIDVFSDWKMASEQGEWVGQWNAKDGPVEISGTYFAKWHKLNEQWLIRAEIFVPLKCTGGSFCADAPF
jgi:ketosteroid isomerase-like protein